MELTNLETMQTTILETETSIVEKTQDSISLEVKYTSEVNTTNYQSYRKLIAKQFYDLFRRYQSETNESVKNSMLYDLTMLIPTGSSNNSIFIYLYDIKTFLIKKVDNNNKFSIHLLENYSNDAVKEYCKSSQCNFLSGVIEKQDRKTEKSLDSTTIYYAIAISEINGMEGYVRWYIAPAIDKLVNAFGIKKPKETKTSVKETITNLKAKLKELSDKLTEALNNDDYAAVKIINQQIKELQSQS